MARTITGGTVVVGAEQSLVHLGEAERIKVDCDGGKQSLTDRQARESAATVFRGMSPPQPAVTPPWVTIHGLSPIVEVKGAGRLVVERLDQQNERHEMGVGGQSLLRGRFYDFAKGGKSLAPGGVYAASFGGQRIVFKVDAEARPGATPVIGRLLRFK